MLPFRQQTLPIKGPQLRVTQPDCRKICRRAACSGSHFDADDSIFPAVSLCSFHTQFVKSLQIMLVDGRYWGAFLRRFEKCPERLELV
jgi:hypothetical protein